MTIKPIETQYKGYRFRSRLEARWAVFFETLGCSWEYEPEGFDLNGLYYLPDFKVKYPSDKGYTWFEVKSSIENLSHDEIKKMTMFAKYIDDVYLLDGTPDLGAYLRFCKQLRGLTYGTYNNYLFIEFLEEMNSEDYQNAPGEGDVIYHARLKGKSDDEHTRMNNMFLRDKSEEGMSSPRTRFGDVLYTHEDGGRIFYANYGGDIDSEWEPELTNAVTAARSARFEHGESPGRYE